MTATVIFTIGHSNHSIAEFISWLQAYDIQQLIDIRRHPGSRRLPQFNRATLQHSLTEAGIRYNWQGEVLGGMRDLPLQHSLNDDQHYIGLPEDSLRNFASHMNTPVCREAMQDLVQQAATAPGTIMCAEKDPYHCHRRLISDYLTLGGYQVLHITGRDQLRSHKISPTARYESGSIYYDRGTQLPLKLG